MMIKKLWHKFKSGWFSNSLIILLIVIFIVPSWRLAFSSSVQRLFMSSTTLKKSINIPLNFSDEQWIIFDSKGKMHSFNDYKGKPIVLTFWATWCPSCRAEMPQINNLKNSFKTDVQFISVSNESMATIKASGELKKHGDFIYNSSNFSPQFNFSVYPTTFIIDSDFNIVHKLEGAAKLDSKENINFLLDL